MELQYLTLVLPAFVLFTIGIIVPIVLCLYYSFTEWDGFSAHIQFVNIQNYINIFRDKSVMSSWAFTIKFAVLNAGIADILTLLLAVLMDKAMKGVKLYRMILFIPCLFSSIVTGFVWTKIYAVVLPDICARLEPATFGKRGHGDHRTDHCQYLAVVRALDDDLSGGSAVHPNRIL